MKKYITIVSFIDLQDGNHEYKVGDVFPHQGLTVSDERIDELATSKNRRRMPLIKKVKSDDVDGTVPKPKKLVRKGNSDR